MRFVDVFVSVIVLLVLLPIILWISYKVAVNLGRPVIFRQKRPGRNGEIFEMLKFRSMMDAADEHGNVLPDEKRMTSFGAWLRSTSLDELPELWNVLKGEMSLVGPRPLLIEYLPLYDDEQARRHEVRPGITGWAQVNGRNAISWDEKFSLDVWYVDNRSFWLDIKILFMTIKKVLCRNDIAAANHVTVEKFRGHGS